MIIKDPAAPLLSSTLLLFSKEGEVAKVRFDINYMAAW
jgi:hypothetical protein